MLGVDDSVALALLVAVLVGLRHATDPDHLTAVAALVLGERDGVRRAGRLGLAWGAGHATTLLAAGAPAILLQRTLPSTAEQAAEVLVGVAIVALAVRLLVRAGKAGSHVHRHAGARSAPAAFGIGALHGIGGSAAITLLLLGAIPDATAALAALTLFAAAAAVSMATLSAGFGHVLGRLPDGARIAAVTPAFGAAGVLFGAWYALAALQASPF